MSTQQYTITDIKAANKAAGLNFFERGTMRFFDSKVASKPYSGPGGVYFVTSEQFHGSDGHSAPRKYTVRKFDPATGVVNTPGAFNAMSMEQARWMARDLARGAK